MAGDDPGITVKLPEAACKANVSAAVADLQRQLDARDKECAALRAHSQETYRRIAELEKQLEEAHRETEACRRAGAQQQQQRPRFAIPNKPLPPPPLPPRNSSRPPPPPAPPSLAPLVSKAREARIHASKPPPRSLFAPKESAPATSNNDSGTPASLFNKTLVDKFKNARAEQQEEEPEWWTDAELPAAPMCMYCLDREPSERHAPYCTSICALKHYMEQE